MKFLCRELPMEEKQKKTKMYGSALRIDGNDKKWGIKYVKLNCTN